MLLSYPGELYRPLGASSCLSLLLKRFYTGVYDVVIVINIALKNNNVNDSQNLAFVASHFVIELLTFDYLSSQKQ
jgi:hypothetical protein